MSQHADTNAHACDASRSDVVRGRSQRPRRKRKESPTRCEPWQGQDDCGSCETDAADEYETKAYSDRVARKDGSGEGEWSQGSAVDQPEHDERQAEGPHAGGTGSEAADDRDSDDIVEPAGKRKGCDGGSPVRSCERERLRTLVRRDELSPPVGLECVAKQGENRRRDQETWVAARERPGHLGEVPGSHDRDDEHDNSQCRREREPRATGSREAHEAVREV